MGKFLGKQERSTDHVGAVANYRELACRAVAPGATGDCTRAAGHSGFHQNGATRESFAADVDGAANVSMVKPTYFRQQYDRARADSTQIAAATSQYDGQRGTTYFHWSDGVSHAGFAIRADGELVYVFSTARGMGDALVKAAIARGATHLDCFDGYLVSLYSRNGFQRVTSLPNWTEGEPDVVFMSLPGEMLAALGKAESNV